MADKIVIEKEFESLGIMFPVLFLLWFSCFVCETTLNYGQKRQQKYGNVACLVCCSTFVRCEKKPPTYILYISECCTVKNSLQNSFFVTCLREKWQLHTGNLRTKKKHQKKQLIEGAFQGNKKTATHQKKKLAYDALLLDYIYAVVDLIQRLKMQKVVLYS